jgi:hypothetical protein
MDWKENEDSKWCMEESSFSPALLITHNRKRGKGGRGKEARGRGGGGSERERGRRRGGKREGER